MNVERIVDERIKRALARFRAGIERVTDLVFGDEAVSGKGFNDHDIDMEVGSRYGMQSRPPDGAEGLAAKVDGRGGNSVLISFRHRTYELAIEKGEVVLRDDQQQHVYLKRDGIELSTGGATLKMNRSDGSIDATAKPGSKIRLAGSGPAAARQNDQVTVSIPPNTVVVAATGATFNATPILVNGNIVGPCSPNVEIG